MSTPSSNYDHEDRKHDMEFAETINPTPTHATYLSRSNVAELSPEHREYLLKRHGTLELDPLPAYGDADPYNWPTWKKTANLILVAWHACMSTFTAAAIIPAYENIAAALGVSLQRTTYLTSLQIAILGAAPLFWRPLANHYGRRPVFLLSLIISLVGNIGCAKSSTYASMAACRAIVAFFISPAAAIGSGVVMECFFKKDRARYMGIWTLMVTLGVPLSPFIFGFVAYRVNWVWIYWILAIINGVQFILYLFLGPETRYIRRGVEHRGSNFKQEYMQFRRIDPSPMKLSEFISPLGMARRPCVLIPAIAYAMVFLFGSVLITVEIPQLFAQKFGFNTEQLGLQFLGIIIGSVLGEQVGGFLSDVWMNRGARRHNRNNNEDTANPTPKRQPEFRLWLSYPGILLTIVGVIVFLIQLQNTPDAHYNVTPIVGAAIAAGGNQIVTTVLITYAVDCCNPEESGSVGVFITFVRQTWGFIGPFWFPDMFTSLGLVKSAGVTTALLVGVSFIPVGVLQWKGKAWRKK